jgi:archaellum component FlaC
VYGARCTGAELLNYISNNEKELFGRQYLLYIIALATTVDDVAIRWLCRNARAIDSLTGESIAFIVFYDSLKFYATPPSETDLPVDINRAINETMGPKMRNVVEPIFPTFSVTKKQLQSCRLNVEPDYDLQKKAFLISTTYESEKAAKALGIKHVDLPCLVFIDDPSCKEKYLLHMEFNDRLFRYLRKIVDIFDADNNVKAYMELIDELNKLQGDLEDLKMQKSRIKRDLELIPEQNLQLNSMSFHTDDYPHAKAKLKKWLNGVYGVQVPTEVKFKILKPFTQDLFYNFRRINKIESRSNEISFMLSKQQIFDNAKLKIKRLYLKNVRPLLSEKDRPPMDGEYFSKDQWKSMFDDMLSPQNAKNLSIKAKFCAIQDAINDISVSSIRYERAAKLNNESTIIQSQIIEKENEINSIKTKIDQIGRPKIGNIIEKINRKENIRSRLKEVYSTARPIIEILRLIKG